MAFGTMTSRVLGLLRDVALAAFFDRALTDAWIAAFRLPNLFRRLLGEGSLSVSFVPVFIESRQKQDGRANDLRDGFFTLLVMVLTVITAIGIIYPEPILRVLLDADYVAQTEKFLMTVRMARLMFGFVFFISLYAFFMGLLNAFGVFALPAMAPTFFNIALIVSTLMPPSWFPMAGDGLSYGVLLGGALQMAILVPALARRGQLPRLRWVGFTPEMRTVLRNMVPGLFGLGLLQISTIINLRFASELGEGAISWIYWADRLLELPLSLVAVSLGTALLPTLSAQWAGGRKTDFSETLLHNLRLNLFICFAAAAGLYLLADPIVELLYQRQKFSAADAAATASVVRVWALIMLPTAAVRLLAPAYYAVKNTWLPAVVSAICLAVHIAIAPILMREWGLTGLNLSSLVSASLNFLCLIVLFPAFVTGFPYLRFIGRVLMFVPGLVVLGGICLLYPFAREWLGDGFFARLISLGGIIVLAASGYGLTSRALRLEEWGTTAGRLEHKIRRRLGSR